MRYGGAVYQLWFHCKNFKWCKMKTNIPTGRVGSELLRIGI